MPKNDPPIKKEAWTFSWVLQSFTNPPVTSCNRNPETAQKEAALVRKFRLDLGHQEHNQLSSGGCGVIAPGEPSGYDLPGEPRSLVGRPLGAPRWVDIVPCDDPLRSTFTSNRRSDPSGRHVSGRPCPRCARGPSGPNGRVDVFLCGLMWIAQEHNCQ